jgi:tetratricopeptide (TPR) repeat protein
MTFDRHYLNALLLEDDQDWPQVRDQLEAGLSVGVFRPHAQFVLGRALEKLGRYGDARRTYEQALEREPNAWYTYNGLGIAAKKQGDYDAAQAAYGRALRLYPQSDQVQINLGALFKEQGDRAKQQGHPPLADSFYHRAEAAYRLADPPSSGVQNNLGNLFKATARFDSAETAYLRAIELDSTMVEAHFNLGDLYMKQGRRDQAVVHLRTAAGITPDNARVAWALGLALEAAGRSGDALEAFSRTLLLDPGFAKALYKLGNIRFEQGDYERAASAFTRFLDIWEGDAVYREFAEGRRAEAAMEMGRQGR